jgi:hypothetical protein
MHGPTYKKRGGKSCPWNTTPPAIGKWRTRQSTTHRIRSTIFVSQSACRARCSAWAEGWGPDFYRVGVTRRITHRARLEWQRQREAEAAAAGEAKK